MHDLHNLHNISTSSSFSPHGDCLHWNTYLILMHSSADFLSFLACSIISLVALYVYTEGRLRGANRAYPSLWLLGSTFLATYALSRLGAFLEIWYGGAFYWWTGANKVILSLAIITFAVRFWKYRESMVTIGRVMASIEEQEKRERVDDLSDTSVNLLVSNSTKSSSSIRKD